MRCKRDRWALTVLLAAAMAPGALSHPPAHKAIEEAVAFASPVADLAGTLLQPQRSRATPCVLIVGGTLSQDRDGGLIEPAAPHRDALRRLAAELAKAGYASLRYDKPGFGKSRTRSEWRGTYRDEARNVEAALAWLRSRNDVARVIVAGESAGAYLACLAAAHGCRADGYVFLGALCGPAEELYAYNFGRLVEYAESNDERKEWVLARFPEQLALGRHYRALFAAARDGKAAFELVDGGYRRRLDLARRKEELDWPPDRLFRNIQAPALALAGEYDANVPPEHARRAAEIMRAAGNETASFAVVANADHSFQTVPHDPEERFRERHTFDSFRRPYAGRMYEELIAWLRRTFPVPGAGVVPVAAQTAEAAPAGALRIDPETEFTPRRVQLAPGVELIDDITNAQVTAGVATLEGRIGPLLLAEGCQCHFIDMPAGLFLAEHPHSTESIIYTVRGSWVLCSGGRRHLMQPGSIFRFGRNISTGYEVPFDENAFLLIFKGDRGTERERDFIEYLRGLAGRLEKEHKAGTPFLLQELPADHPARVFARKVNPRFEAKGQSDR